MSGRPLDELEAAVGAEVSVRLKSGEHYRGTLAGFDQHMNLVLEDLEFGPELGESVAPDGGGSGDDADASGDGADAPTDAASGSGSDPSDESRDDRTGASASEAAESGPGTGARPDRDTTIIRGDNVVSITL